MRNERVRVIFGVVSIEVKMKEKRLWWFEYVMRMKDTKTVTAVMITNFGGRHEEKE